MRWSHRSSRGSRSRPPRNPQPPTPPYKLDSPLPYAPYKLDAPLPYAPYKTDTLPPAVLPSVPRTVASRTRFCCAAATKRGAPFIHSSSSFNLSDAVHQRLRRPGNRRRRRLNRPGDPGAGTTPPARGPLRTNWTRLPPSPRTNRTRISPLPTVPPAATPPPASASTAARHAERARLGANHACCTRRAAPGPLPGPCSQEHEARSWATCVLSAAHGPVDRPGPAQVPDVDVVVIPVGGLPPAPPVLNGSKARPSRAPPVGNARKLALEP